MIRVYMSHIGEQSLQGVSVEEVHAGTLQAILNTMNLRHPGFLNEVLDASKKRLSSATLCFKNINVDDDERFLESEHTKQVRRLDEQIDDTDTNALIAIFHPQQLMTFLLETLTPTDRTLDQNRSRKKYRTYISPSDELDGGQSLYKKAEPERLYPFTNGRPMRELITEDLIDIFQQRFIPRPLQNAIASLWEITENHPLRLFQEESLIHILQELSKEGNVERQPLLLSIPTGGGKTEAFLIPLIAHLHNQRERLLRRGQVPVPAVRAIVAYPTRALANDQAKRISEILFQMNSDAIEDRKISVGVLTGDTPTSGQNLLTEKSILQLCPRCTSVLTDFPEKTMPGTGNKMTITRCICGAEIDYFRLVRQDILEFPPDILITSPDMINYMLQSPRYRSRIFSPAIDVVVFDEIHMYSSVFGCNVAHLLRRFEGACERKPLYVGVSATIRNAKALACLIFNANLEDVSYLRPAQENEEVSSEKRPYLDYRAEPDRYRYHYAVAPSMLSENQWQKTTTSVLNIADVIGHIIRDPHFRKTLIFANFRQDTDDILRFLRDQEDRYYRTYKQSILPRLLAATGMASNTAFKTAFTKVEQDIISAVERWFSQAQNEDILYQPNLEIGWHRGGLEREERIKAVNRFAATKRLSVPDEDNSELPIDLMVATSTLELGIDIGDVTTVMNCGAPFTVNEYVQRVGRGGRRRDALALTVIDPRSPLDFYFLKHFENYAHPTSETFEDAPIIISNMEVVKSHIYARLLDAIALYLSKGSNYKEEIQVSDLQDMMLQTKDGVVSFRGNWEMFSRTLFHQVFPTTKIQQFRRWLQREVAIISNINGTDITLEEMQKWWMAKCMQLADHIQNSDFGENDYLSGIAPKDRQLVPDLRSSGPSVGLYLVSEAGEDKPRDVIARRQAITSRPVGGYASQGSVTFKIESVKDADHDTERAIRELFAYSSEASHMTSYFHRMFGDTENKTPFPAQPIDVLVKVQLTTPKDLSVKYNPYRFYCPNCGATYSDKKAGDERCSSCYHSLRQLTETYICGGCGEMYAPPVPKVCINPDCIAQAKSRKDQKLFMDGGYKQVGKGDRHNDYFHFTALPMLHWQCRACRTEINYHAYYELPEHIRRILNDTTWGNANPAQIAKSFLNRPESWWGKTYTQDGFHPAYFTCPKCKKANTYKRIDVKNIPSFRSVVHEYVNMEREIASELQTYSVKMHFKQINVVALAREHFRRFYSHPEQTTIIDLSTIFSDNSKYLANKYLAHAVFFRFGDALDRFVMQEASSYCQLGSQCRCSHQQAASSLDEEEESGEVENTGPKPLLQSWEIGRKPDPRRKWCDVVQGRVENAICPGQEQHCTSCEYFQPSRYQHYLILHTLAHAIMTAMPKYVGINKNQIREMLFPNDEKEYDLVLIDTIEGGSGCMYLLRKNWEQIWQVTGELLDEAVRERGELLLPYNCLRYNKDLCPHLAYEFYKYISHGRGSNDYL